MRIALVGPITPTALRFTSSAASSLPSGHNFGMNADLVNGLIERGHSVEVFTKAPGATSVFRLSAGSSGLTMVPARGRISALRLFSQEISDLASELVKRGPFDIVHAHWLYEYALASLSTQFPVLVTMHDWPLLILKHNPSFLRLAKYALSQRVRRKVRFLTAPSPYMVEVAEKRLGFRNVTLVQNAIPRELLSAFDRVVPQKSILVAINIGFDRRKNVSGLMRAFAQLRIDIPDAELRLIGPEYGPGGVAERFAREAKISGGIRFLGSLARQDIIAELKSASLFVHPSLEESFGIVLIEAMSQKVAVLAGQSSGAVPWLLDFGKAGYLTDVTDPLALARAIKLALDDSNLTTVANNGWSRVCSNFTVDKMIDKYVEQYYIVREQW